ncbi:uncharacterized protein [Rutidosis leptorrhynchoides]
MRSPDESDSDKHDNQFKPIQSLPKRWKSKDYSWQQIPVDTYDDANDDSDPLEQRFEQESVKNREVSNTRGDNKDQVSVGRSSSSSEVSDDVSEPNTSMNATIDHTIDSSFIFPELYQCLQSSIPNIVKGCRWVLLYSTLRHGISLRTLIRKSSDLSGPCLLVTGDTKGAVFGGLLNGPLIPTPKRKYQGTYETFVFTTLYGAPRLFRPTGANRYYYMCLNDMLALGGGGKFALSLDEDLLTGTSGSCDTFGNQCLAHDESFAVKNVELWGFAHSSRYP